jgi:hypothetical protein
MVISIHYRRNHVLPPTCDRDTKYCSISNLRSGGVTWDSVERKLDFGQLEVMCDMVRFSAIRDAHWQLVVGVFF